MNTAMRKAGVALVFSCTLAQSLSAAGGEKLALTGQMVDHLAMPVQGAEVVVCEQYRIGDRDTEARMIGPVVRTDGQGRFALEADVTRQRDVFIVARKPGFAHAWEWLNCSLNTLERKHFSLVLEPPGVLAGQVVDADGRPAAGAEVQAVPVKTCGFSGVIDRWAVPGPGPWFKVQTDSQGEFRFEQLPADASAALRVQAQGSESRYAFRLHIMESCGFTVGRSDLRLTLPREGTIHGRTVDPRGRPVGAVDLMVRSGRSDEDITNLYIARKLRSDPAGTFTFTKVPEGPQMISVVAPEGDAPLWTAGDSRVSVKAGGVTETSIRVVKGGVLEVTVLDGQTRRPVRDATLGVHSQRRRVSRSAVADARGVARVRVPADSYAVYVSAPRYLACQDTIQTNDGQTIRREARLIPSPTVSGQVLDPRGRPAGEVAVVVHPFGDHVYTDPQGKFEAYYDEQQGARLAVTQAVGSGLAAVTRVDDPSKPIDLRLGPAWTLAGRVADLDGVGIPAARVSLCLHVHHCLSNLGVEVLTDREGRFEIKAIPPVQEGFEYCISANAAGYGPATRLKTFLCGLTGPSVDLGTIRLPRADASVSGVVVDAQGKPAARIPVFVNDGPGLEQPRRSTATDDRGEFTITRVCSGPARLQADFASSPSGPGFLTTRLPAQNVRIVRGKDQTDASRTPGPDAGSPQLVDLCPAFSQLLTDGRPILLCLADPLQPSSRECLVGLAGKTEALAARGVITIGVLTTKVDFQQHNAFVKANHIAFPNYGAGDDFEIRKVTWGIKSVPWLILTDGKHTVVAEDFAIDELESKLASLADRN